ncbi:RES domain-containing protein [Pseudomonas sp. H9]|uniref:RES domain-containing protein n=1 Tax=Pseudomonas sp. H9 TaxID=483968 RepID=UPI00105818D7|nr:RES domain-containing protein [Pseudomonas sp. H9]TDF85196.1 RES domain-containing protein [Pseudomonas sp. H9]
MARCCTNCFSDTAVIEKIYSTAELNRCSFCGANRVQCVNPLVLRDKIEIFTYGLTESTEGKSFSDILANIYGIISPNVRNPNLLIDAIFNEPGFGEKKHIFDFELDGHNQSWEEFKVELKHKNRFFPKNTIYSSIFKEASQSTDSSVFFQLLEQLKTPIYKEDKYYRARISEEPLTRDKMGTPPHSIVSGGRANPIGIPYLYLAENIETCISEVRPSNSSSIYVSEFSPDKDLYILDLTEPRKNCSMASFEENQLEPALNFLNLLELLSADLSKPIRPENSHLEYIPTQFLCEFIKSEARLDGLSFNSSFETGKNYVMFDSEAFTTGDPSRYIVTKTTHETEPKMHPLQ